MTRRLLVFTTAMLACLPALAWAHGIVASTKPEANGVVSAPPKRVSVTLTETPTDDAVMRVVDGCDRQVVEAVAVRDDTITATLSDPHPGHFRVQWKAISAVDGHPTDGKFAFHVDGKPQCSQGNNDGSDGGNNGGADDPAAPDDDSAAPAPDGGDGESSSFPFLPVGIGVVAVAGLALIARRAGAR